MAGILNQTVRPFNLKQRDKDGFIVVVRLAPGLNLVDNDDWKTVSSSDFCQHHIKQGDIIESKSVSKEDESDPDKKAQSKKVPVVGKGGSAAKAS